MDCYDDVLKIYHENNRIDNYIDYMTNLINNKSEALTELQFKNCLILTMVISSPNYIDTYFSKGKKKIVELHDGKMWFESEGRNKGSTFYFSLPII